MTETFAQVEKERDGLRAMLQELIYDNDISVQSGVRSYAKGSQTDAMWKRAKALADV